MKRLPYVFSKACEAPSWRINKINFAALLKIWFHTSFYQVKLYLKEDDKVMKESKNQRAVYTRVRKVLASSP